VISHENAHGWVALALGDETAKKSGRLTLNPVKHFDFVGSLILPAMLYFTTGGMFGYAKPVPVNPSKLHGKDRWGFAVVALAGPVSNVILALIASVIASTLYGFRLAGGVSPGDVQNLGGSLGPFLLSVAFTLNMLLAA